MAERRVEGVRKDQHGGISEICGSWGLSSVEDAVREIKSGSQQYYVEEGGVRTRVEVASSEDGEYLRTVDDPSLDNHLANLPEC